MFKQKLECKVSMETLDSKLHCKQGSKLILIGRISTNLCTMEHQRRAGLPLTMKCLKVVLGGYLILFITSGSGFRIFRIRQLLVVDFWKKKTQNQRTGKELVI